MYSRLTKGKTYATMYTYTKTTGAKMQKEIEQLEALADKMFAQGKTFLGNQILEIVYCLEAEQGEE